MGKRGPKRSLRAQQAILGATLELVAAHGIRGLRIDDVAQRAGVSKATIYRWWPTKAAVLVDSLVAAADPALVFPDSGSTREDLRRQMRRVARVFSSATGRAIAAAVAEAQQDHEVAAAFREGFLRRRRLAAAEVLRRGIERGEVRGDLDIEAAVDALYAPLWLRLLVGHQPLTARAVDRLVTTVWPGLEERG